MRAQKASFQAARAFYTAQSYLAADKPSEAAALFERARERVSQAEAAWDDLERPDAAALADLTALAAQAQVRSSNPQLYSLSPLHDYLACSLLDQGISSHHSRNLFLDGEHALLYHSSACPDSARQCRALELSLMSVLPRTGLHCLACMFVEHRDSLSKLPRCPLRRRGAAWRTRSARPRPSARSRRRSRAWTAWRSTPRPLVRL